MLSDREIEASAKPQNIVKIGAKLGLGEEVLDTFGKLKAKIALDLVADLKLDETFAKFAASAKPFHGGKSYPDVEIFLEAKVK